MKTFEPASDSAAGSKKQKPEVARIEKCTLNLALATARFFFASCLRPLPIWGRHGHGGRTAGCSPRLLLLQCLQFLLPPQKTFPGTLRGCRRRQHHCRPPLPLPRCCCLGYFPPRSRRAPRIETMPSHQYPRKAPFPTWHLVCGSNDANRNCSKRCGLDPHRRPTLLTSSESEIMATTTRGEHGEGGLAASSLAKGAAPSIVFLSHEDY